MMKKNEKKRVTAKAKQQTGSFVLLHALQRFLNTDFANVEEAQGENLFIDACWQDIVDSLKSEHVDWRTAAQNLQQELRTDILGLLVSRDILNPSREAIPLPPTVLTFDSLAAPQYAARFDSLLLTNLAKLITKINAMSMRAHLWLVGSRPDRGDSHLPEFSHPRWGSFQIQIKDQVSGKSAREKVYWWLRSALLDGTYSSLNTCKFCNRFFIPRDQRRQFCEGTTCKDGFFNKNRKSSGYHQKLRQQKRRLALKQAKALRQDGKSLSFIKQKTGLTSRVLEREGIIE